MTVIVVKNEPHYDIIAWLRTNIGPGGYRVPDYERWGDRWGCVELDSMPGPGRLAVQFINEEDAVLFKLRWA